MFYVIILPVVFHIILLVTGSAGSFFILVVQFLDWLKTHHLSSVDLIIITIAFINLLLQGFVGFNEICMFLFVEFYVQVWIVNSLLVILSSLASSSLWCSATLCFYYYMKIITFSGTMFYKLKAKLPVIVPWLLFFLNVIACITGLPAYWDIYIDSPPPMDNATSIPLTNHINFKSRCRCMFLVYITSASMAFSIILFTAGSFVRSIYKHMRQIKKNNVGLRHVNLSAHISAARTVSFLLILHLAFYGMLILEISNIQDTGSVMFIVCSLVMSSFPTLNEVILIWGNGKLSEKLKFVLGVKSISENTGVSVTT